MCCGGCREGRASFAATPCLRGSVWINDEGQAEVAHLAGRWCASCAAWLERRAFAWAARRGQRVLVVQGRKGWARKLRASDIMGPGWRVAGRKRAEG